MPQARKKVEENCQASLWTFRKLLPEKARLSSPFGQYLSSGTGFCSNGHVLRHTSIIIRPLEMNDACFVPFDAGTML